MVIHGRVSPRFHERNTALHAAQDHEDQAEPCFPVSRQDLSGRFPSSIIRFVSLARAQKKPCCSTVAVNSPRQSTRGFLAPQCFTCKSRLFSSEPPRTRTWNLEIKSLWRGVSARLHWLQIWLE